MSDLEARTGPTGKIHVDSKDGPSAAEGKSPKPPLRLYQTPIEELDKLHVSD